jgi:hypothetical protein
MRAFFQEIFTSFSQRLVLLAFLKISVFGKRQGEFGKIRSVKGLFDHA